MASTFGAGWSFRDAAIRGGEHRERAHLSLVSQDMMSGRAIQEGIESPLHVYDMEVVRDGGVCGADCEMLDDEEPGGVSLLSNEGVVTMDARGLVDSRLRAAHGLYEDSCSHSDVYQGGVELSTSTRNYYQQQQQHQHQQDYGREVNSALVQTIRGPPIHDHTGIHISQTSVRSIESQRGPLLANVGEHALGETDIPFHTTTLPRTGLDEAQQREDVAHRNINTPSQDDTFTRAVTEHGPLNTSGSTSVVEGSHVNRRDSNRRGSNNEAAYNHVEPLALADHVPDVMNFLERWHMQLEMPQAGIVRLDPERIRQWRPPSADVDEAPLNRGRDIQRLDWQSLDTTRTSARAARKVFCSPNIAHKGARSDVMRSTKEWPYYTFKRMYSDHKAKFTHGQLRHVLAATSRNEVFYAAYNKVMRTSLACPSVCDTVVNLSSSSLSINRATVNCHITTIAASPAPEFTGYVSDSVLVTGGFEGEYSLLNLNSHSGQHPVEGFVTDAMDGITTHIHTPSARRSGALMAAFCSNDRKLRLLDVGTNSWVSTFEYSDHLNCAATSPDGRLRVVVGDTNETFITDAERGTSLFTTRQHNDDAFACAWADDGWHVATGAQDGKVVIYDARNWRAPVAKLDCEMGCARSLHFTRAGNGSGSPALVVAEADDIVSVHDTRDWAVKQTMDFFGAVAGIAVLDGGRELVVANGDATVGGLMVFERNDDSFSQMENNGSIEVPRVRRTTARSSRSRRENSSLDSSGGTYPNGFGIGIEQLLV